MLVWPTPKPAVLTGIAILEAAFGEYAFVSAKLPKRKPERFVRVSRVGGGLQNIASDAPRLLIECYALDVGQVEAMLNTARTALRNAGGTTVTTTQGPVAVRAWNAETLVSDFPNPDLIEFERGQLSGQLLLKAN